MDQKVWSKLDPKYVELQTQMKISKPSLDEWFFGLEYGLFLYRNKCCSPNHLQLWIDLSWLLHHNIQLMWEPNLHQWLHLHIQYPPSGPTIYSKIDRLSDEFSIFSIFKSHVITDCRGVKSNFELCLFHQPKYDDAHDHWKSNRH